MQSFSILFKTAGLARLLPVPSLLKNIQGLIAYCFLCLAGLSLPAMVWGQSSAQITQADLQNLRSNADLLLLVVCGALVFFMQAGFSFLEAGMARAKNSVNVLMKNYIDMCAGAPIFYFLGYGLMFGVNETGWLGTSFLGAQPNTTISYGHIFFQMMFAATSATIVSGAIAERAQFPAYIIGSMLISGIIYPVFGAWAWGGTESSPGWLRELGFIDFSGSSVVHAIGGWASLAALLVIGPRLGRFGPNGEVRQILGHNLSMVSLGAFILWVGWFGFNVGSSGVLSKDLGKIALNTHLGGACGALGAILLLLAMRRKILLTATLNASIAGLVSVTAGCQVMAPEFAAITGLLGGFLYVLSADLLEALGIDDVVGALSVHLMGGIWGTLAVGLFKQGDMFNPNQISVQALGILMSFVWGFGASYLMYRLLDKVIPLRASALDEQRGLDYSEHHEVGYPEFQKTPLTRGTGNE